jgi:type IV pilus assembly protein PilM
MIFRTYLALDIAPGEMRGAALRRRGKQMHLVGVNVVSCEGIVAVSGREPNITDPQRFVKNVREVLAPLAGKEERIALLLPDGAGRVVLTGMESPPRSKEEGIEILKWQLRDKLPAEPGEVRLDYQVVAQEEGGQRVMVSMIAAPVLEQYEDLIIQAGFGAALVDFHSLNLYSCYSSRLNFGKDFALVGVEGAVFSLQIFHEGAPVLYRVRELSPDPAKVFQEAVRSLAGCRRKYPALRQESVFLHTDRDDRQELAAALCGAFEQEVALLDPGSWEGGAVCALLAAPVGAAERLMRGSR